MMKTTPVFSHMFCDLRGGRELPLQQFACYPGTGFCVSESVMVVGELVATGGGYGVELVVGQMGQLAARGA